MSNGTITMTGAEYDALAGKIAALESELARLRAGQEPVAFYWQDAGYKNPNRHGPYFGWPTEAALRNVDGGAIPVPLYTAQQPSAVPDIAGWLWHRLMDYCKKNSQPPATRNDLFAVVSDLRKMLAAAPSSPATVPSVNQQLLEAATESLDEIQAVMQEAYNSAVPVCCGRGRNECCGSPDPEWNEYDQRTMDRFAPIERALRAAIAAARKEGGKV